ncbi:MAG: hypothetical protein IH864_04010 [Chloroflexi bacterium]|nr:hypothetical protein [Chloroflexota bacterium]
MRGDIALFLGLVAVIGGGIILAVVFLFGGGGDGGSSACDSPLPPLGESEVSQLGFQTEEVGLTKVIEAATVGNLEAAESAFFGDVHNFTHNVDAPLREVDEELAIKLCEEITEIEEELAFGRRISVIAGQATRLRELIQDAAEALGFARPGG